MDGEAEPWLGSAYPAPPMVSLASLTPTPSPSPRRLSSSFMPSRPVVSARRLAWVSLQGRLVNAEEASSSKAIGLSRAEAVSWELFTPVQRFLIVAVIGAATARSKKDRVIFQLQKSVEFRDQVLTRMQQKLDDLCEQMDSVRYTQSVSGGVDLKTVPTDGFGGDKIKFVECACWHCDEHHDLFMNVLGDSVSKGTTKGDEVLQYKTAWVNEVEQEERRMSDLSDWASSVTSIAEIQMNTIGTDRDIMNLKKECEDKDMTIKDLTTILQSTNVASSKRIAELEEIIRRKNSTITKLKKDMMVLEQKLVQLMRVERPSTSLSISQDWKVPLMVDNIVYDMDSSTSSSSSDSDSSPSSRPQAPVESFEVNIEQVHTNSPSSSDTESSSVSRRQAAAVKVPVTPIQSNDQKLALDMGSLGRVPKRVVKSRSVSPLKEISANHKSSRTHLSAKHSLAGGEFKRIRRQTQTASKYAAAKKRWV